MAFAERDGGVVGRAAFNSDVGPFDVVDWRVFEKAAGLTMGLKQILDPFAQGRVVAARLV